jgi:ubiquinol-cytochrome c reductase cytochrome c subunit
VRRGDRRHAGLAPRLATLGLLGGVAVLALLPFAPRAGASGRLPGPTTTTTTQPTTTGGGPVLWRGIPPTYPSPYDRLNSGMPNASIRIFNKAGQLDIYGNSSILYVAPQLLAPPAQRAAMFAVGGSLYAQQCSACHGVEANGVPQPGTPGSFPNLQHISPAAIDFWVASGRMPAVQTNLTQPNRRFERLSPFQALEIATWINDQWPATPYIPQFSLHGANLSNGAALFAENCAACHTITGDGDALANDTFAPSLRDISPLEVAEALRTGPANMPVFSGQLTDAQLRDVIAYVVERIEHPQNPGGLGLGGLGPVGEGFVGLAIGVGLLAIIAFWIGDNA